MISLSVINDGLYKMGIKPPRNASTGLEKGATPEETYSDLHSIPNNVNSRSSSSKNKPLCRTKMLVVKITNMCALSKMTIANCEHRARSQQRDVSTS